MNKELLERINGTKDWLILNTSGLPYITWYVIYQCSQGVYRKYPNSMLVSFCGVRYTNGGSQAQFFARNNEYHDSFEKIINDRTTLQSIYEVFCREEKDYTEFTEHVRLEGESYLHEHYADFIRLYNDEYHSALVIDGSLAFSEAFFSKMKEKYPSKEAELQTLIHPYGQTFLGRYKGELLKLTLEIKKGNNSFSDASALLADEEIKAKLEAIQSNFFWIKNNYKNVTPLETSFFAGELFEILSHDITSLERELEEINSYATTHQATCEEIKAHFEQEDYEKLLWLGKIGWWVDRRKEYNLKGNYFISLHLQDLCKKHALIYDDAAFLLPDELRDVVEGKTTIADYKVEERKKEFINIRDIDGNEIAVSGQEATDLWAKISKPMHTDEVKEIKGSIGFKGMARGRVRVVMDANNEDDFQEGDILVTGMTRPDFLSLMKKAAAFVTDEGGITCHAAIVARELKKPCIIGTKNATKLLKDGVMVEVDANVGVVRVVE